MTVNGFIATSTLVEFRVRAVMSLTKKDIPLAFTRGAEFERRFRTLKDLGNKLNQLKFEIAPEVDEYVMVCSFRQAQELKKSR
mgnify:FL=1